MMRKMKLLVLSPLPEQVVEALYASSASEYGAGEIEVTTYRGSTREELIEAVSGADLIMGDYTFNTALDAEALRAAGRCILIQQPSTGYQHIDVAEAARLGIPVANAAGANAVSVAEHTIMVILCCLKKLILAHQKTVNSEWAQDEMANYGVFELSGKTLGIIGMGRIGKEVAGRARAFDPVMIYYDVSRLTPRDEEALGLRYRPLDELIAEADVITVHTPLTPETENMLGEERIAAMKPNAVVVNVSRGAIIDESALARALKEGRLQGAALDVFSEEPINPANPMLGAPNTILTPHIAGATNESRLRIINHTLANIARVLSGREPENIVNGVSPRFPGRADRRQGRCSS